MVKYLSNDLWKTISDLARKSKTIKVAVAYLGKGASELIPLKSNDTLIVNMSIGNVTNGQVNPFEIEKYNELGVDIYNCSNLHAKVYFFDKSVIVCSANISNNSQNGLIECGILTDDKQAIKEALVFIDSLSIEHVTKAYIDLCKKKYNPPKFKEGLYGRQLINQPLIETSNFWVINVRPTTFTEIDDKILQKDLKIFESKLANRDDYEVDSIRFGASSGFIKNVKEGDIVLQIYNSKRSSKILEPMRVLGVTKGRQVNSKGHGNMFLRIEEKINCLETSWSEFQKYLIENNVIGITKKSTKNIKEEGVKRLLHKFWKS